MLLTLEPYLSGELQTRRVSISGGCQTIFCTHVACSFADSGALRISQRMDDCGARTQTLTQHTHT